VGPSDTEDSDPEVMSSPASGGEGRGGRERGRGCGRKWGLERVEELELFCVWGRGGGGRQGRLYSIVTDLFREATEYKFVVYFVSIVSQYPFRPKGGCLLPGLSAAEHRFDHKFP
jgi:hypothetical protein